MTLWRSRRRSSHGQKERDLAEGLTWDNADLARHTAAGQLTTCEEIVESPPVSPFADPMA